MLVLQETKDSLKKRIINGLDSLNTDEIKKIVSMIARLSGKKAVKLADRDWLENSISREQIHQAIKKVRKNKKA
jgi:hypothetical protein